jgi:hypothetical protein
LKSGAVKGGVKKQAEIHLCHQLLVVLMQSHAPAGFSRAFPIRKRSPAEAGSRAFARDEPPTEAGGKADSQA